MVATRYTSCNSAPFTTDEGNKNYITIWVKIYYHTDLRQHRLSLQENNCAITAIQLCYYYRIEEFPWSSSYCSKGKLACCHKCQEEHRGTWSSTLGRKTCMTSFVKLPSNDRYTLACNLYVTIRELLFIRSLKIMYFFIRITKLVECVSFEHKNCTNMYLKDEALQPVS